MRIDLEIIKALDPCASGLNNFIEHYSGFIGDHEDFLRLEKIPHEDKIWVILRLMPRFDVEVFAIDCAVSASINAATAVDYAAYAAYATNAANAAAHSANAAAHSADATASASANYAAYAATYAADTADYAARSAATYAATYAADAVDYAAYAAAYAADTADYAATELKRQIEAIIYLINNSGEV